MAGEVLVRWERFVTEPVFKRYAKYAKEPRALFDSIGEDVASSNQEIREQAFWALVYAMPELASILYEWETRQPGWRDREEKDQKRINPATDIVSYLHRKLVVERRFKLDDEYRKDPRPFVNEEIKHKKIDEWRKRSREVLLDDENVLKIPDPAGSVEDIVLENRGLADPEKEFLALRFLRNDEERSLIRTVYVDHASFAEVAESNGISEVNVRQRLSRARKHAVAERDALFTFFLMEGTFSSMGKLPHFPKNLEMEEWCTEQVIRSVQPGGWLNGLAADRKTELAIRPLTTGLDDAPAHLYLLAIGMSTIAEVYCKNLSDLPPFYTTIETYHHGQLVQTEMRPSQNPFCDLLTLGNQRCLKYVGKLINPKSRRLHQSRYMYRSLRKIQRQPTDLPGLNNALAEVGDYYHTWLISTSVPDPLRVHRWKYGEKAKVHNVDLPKLDNGSLISLAGWVYVL